MIKIVIQHAGDTGRYHPAAYRLAPPPGPGPHPVARYQSMAHHTDGFATLDECAGQVQKLAEYFEADGHDPALVEIPKAGIDILLEPVQ